MSTRKEAPAGAPCWIELFSSDLDRSMHFYCELFGWSVVDGGPTSGGYKAFEKDGASVAGCTPNDPDSVTGDFWTVFLACGNAEATVESAVLNGGQVALAPTDVGDLGRKAMIIDPGQACVGIYQPLTHNGIARIGEPDAPGWFELHTPAYEASIDFYRHVFGWDTHVPSDTSEVGYATFGKDENALAGVMEVTNSKVPVEPAEWRVFFDVEDTATTIARVVELGGAIVGPLQDSPYGRVVGVTDPTGAHFTIRDHR